MGQTLKTHGVSEYDSREEFCYNMRNQDPDASKPHQH
jgi:hypothetical protein